MSIHNFERVLAALRTEIHISKFGDEHSLHNFSYEFRSPQSRHPFEVLMLTTGIFTLLIFWFGLQTSFAKGTAIISFHNHKIVAEVAETDRGREMGLMNRKTLAENHGMLFIFPDDAVRQFWMKNTLIPLDIAFLDSQGKILTLKTMQPLSRDIVSSEKPSRYALEVNAGFFRHLHAHTGETLNIQ